MTEKKLYAMTDTRQNTITRVLQSHYRKISCAIYREAIDELVPIDTDAAVERMARAIADLEPGEPWPTNEELGGGPTGTRDDEFWHDCMDRARTAFDALLGSEQGGTR